MFFSNSLFKIKISQCRYFPIILIMFSLTLKKGKRKYGDMLGNCQAILCRTLGSTLQGLFWICTFFASSYQKTATLSKKMYLATRGWQWHRNNHSLISQMILRPKSLPSRVMLEPALVPVPFWLLKWCWASMSLVELASLWGERYIIRNQGGSIYTHWALVSTLSNRRNE